MLACWVLDWDASIGRRAKARSGRVVLQLRAGDAPRTGWMNGMAASEKAIRPVLERARLGDRSAFGELFSLFEQDVVQLCRRLLGDLPAAEDARSEVFLRAQQSLAGYDPAQPFRRWLLAIAGHHCTDLLRRRKTEARLFDPADHVGEQHASDAPSPLRQLLSAEQRDHLVAEIESLPPRYRIPLVLRYQAELDYAAIAEILQVPPGQVGSLLFRAKARLRVALSDATPGGSGA